MISSQEVNLGIDPFPLYDGQGIDITASVHADQMILKQNFLIGVEFEYFPNKDYLGTVFTLDYPLVIPYELCRGNYFLTKFEARLGVQYGYIWRFDLPTHKGYSIAEYGSKTYIFQTYGVQGSLSYEIFDNFSLYGKLDYKYRSDSVYLWEDAATKWEYSVRVGFRYRWN